MLQFHLIPFRWNYTRIYILQYSSLKKFFRNYFTLNKWNIQKERWMSCTRRFFIASTKYSRYTIHNWSVSHTCHTFLKQWNACPLGKYEFENYLCPRTKMLYFSFPVFMGGSPHIKVFYIGPHIDDLSALQPTHWEAPYVRTIGEGDQATLQTFTVRG